MKKYVTAVGIALGAILLQQTSLAQEKDEKEKTSNKMGEYDEIIIKRKVTGKDGKVTVEIKDGEVKVNGKPIDEYEDENLSVRRKHTMSYNVTARSPFRSGNMNSDDRLNYLLNEDRPFLGVTTDEADGGAKITSVTENSAAEKAGLKKGDIITKINDVKVEGHRDVTTAIGKLKPDDKVSIAYKRDGKENKVTATLKKRSGTTLYAPNADFNFDFDHEGQLGQLFSYGGRPRIGIKAQDTEDGKGVKVIHVDEGSAADKSGIKKDDIITEFEGKVVNSADALAGASRDSKDKSSLSIKLNRGGSSQTVEVKIPRKLKTANL